MENKTDSDKEKVKQLKLPLGDEKNWIVTTQVLPNGHTRFNSAKRPPDKK